VASQLTQYLSIPCDQSGNPRAYGKLVTAAINKQKKIDFQEKIMHGYMFREMEKRPEVDLKASLSWFKNRSMTSTFESYATAVQEQEVASKFLMKIRHKDPVQQAKLSNKCRLCKTAVEDVSHITASCEKMATRYYLPLRHDVVARYIWNAIRRRENGEQPCDNERKLQDGFIESSGDLEYWWNVPVKTCTKVHNNRPDIVRWNHREKQCTIIEVSCPLDTNIIAKEKEKENIYGPLIRNLQIQHPGYKFLFVPIIVGATGFVAKSLRVNLQELGFPESEVAYITRKLQVLAFTGTVKIVKTFLNFRM
jgi:hypothetical protein